MPFILFHDLFPEIAERENRTITVLPNSGFELPAAEYSFLEMYCDEPGCDCRRVFFYVMSSCSKNLEAIVTYGWEPPSFYAAWMSEDDTFIIADLKGPSLNVGSPQSKHAPAILELVRNILLRDPSYIERLKRHYNMFRSKIDVPKGTSKKRKWK
jgi:hypothetical protein